MEEGGLIVLEGCSIPRGHVLEQLTPQALKRTCLSAATACIPEWQAASVVCLCVSIIDVSSDCAHAHNRASVCRACVHQCMPADLSPSVHLLLHVLVRACVWVLLFTKTQERPQVGSSSFPASLSLLTLTLPGVQISVQRISFPRKAPWPFLGRQEMPYGLSSLLVPPHPSQKRCPRLVVSFFSFSFFN